MIDVSKLVIKQEGESSHLDLCLKCPRLYFSIAGRTWQDYPLSIFSSAISGSLSSWNVTGQADTKSPGHKEMAALASPVPHRLRRALIAHRKEGSTPGACYFLH